ncbi:transglycosylase domain-containing protein [Leekyejoonella antrihumi]|uniref:Penicillin-binding protein n=1 Tax=Leekyejoonella antrihumi TaxID=1660198 RepID=A0A563E7V5_9MICO|nr:transglycosylase domain-containing protein [Leekyejoonella antrihumi]TWP38610.1 penicillin-binding protein [Leekyejoonella antrihumi]
MQRTRRVRAVFTLLGVLVATSMAMGLLVAGLALPAVGAAGSATNSSIDLFNEMPSSFAMNPLAQQSRILAADGSVIATPFNKDRIVVPLSRVSKVMQHAQVAIEDKRFFQHGAVDPRGLARAIATNVFTTRTQGASTLVQQYVKVAIEDQALNSGNTALAQRAVSRSGMQGYLRKLQQLKYAVTIEQHYSKDQILDGYLNLVYYGDQQYGIEAAARHYFGVHASQLDLPQAALLAGVVNAPSAYDPRTHPKASVARRNIVLARMHGQGMITTAQLKSAKATGLHLHVTRVSSGCGASKYPYFCYYVYAWLLQQPVLGKTVAARDATLRSGGLTIKTGFQPKRADMMRRKIDAKVPPANGAGVQSAGVMIQPGTGLVLATAQNTSYSNAASPGKQSINYVTGTRYNGGQGFDFGSTAKMFAVVTALKEGRPGNFTIDVPPASGTDAAGQFHVYTHKLFHDVCGLGRAETWKVHNDAPVPAGPMPINRALGQSVNTAFAKLVGTLGTCKVRRTMIDFGMTLGNGQPLNKTPSGMVLGTNAVAPITLANAYATIAAGGKYCAPHPVVSITDSGGKKLKLSGTGCKQVVSAKVAAETTKILRNVFDKGSTAGPSGKLAGGRPAAGKTGTVTGATQTWFVGYTPQLTTAIWVGRANDARPLKNLSLGGTYYHGYIYGGSLAAPLWKSIMDTALHGKPVEQFPNP